MMHGRLQMSILGRTFRLSTLVILFVCLNSLIGVTALRPNYIYDEYDLLTDSQETDINNFLTNVDEQTTCEIVFVIESYLGDYPTIFDMALAYFEDVELDGKTGIGKEGKDNGVLIIMTMKTGDVFIMVGYGLEGDLTDAECGKILDNILIPKLNDYKDFDAIMLTAEAIAKEIGYVKESSEPEKPKFYLSKEEITEILIIITIMIIIIVATLIFHWRKNAINEKRRLQHEIERAKFLNEQKKIREAEERKRQEEWWATRPVMMGHCPKCDTERKSKQIDTKQSESLLDNVWWWIISYYVLKCLTCKTTYQKEYDRKKYETVEQRATRLARDEEERRKREKIEQKRREDEKRKSSYRRSTRSSSSGSFGGGRTGGGGAGRSGGFRPS